MVKNVKGQMLKYGSSVCTAMTMLQTHWNTAYNFRQNNLQRPITQSLKLTTFRWMAGSWIPGRANRKFLLHHVQTDTWLIQLPTKQVPDFIPTGINRL